MDTNGPQSNELKFPFTRITGVSNVINMLPIGVCVPIVSRTEESAFPEVIWYVKDCEEFIQRIPTNNPTIKIISASLKQFNVTVVVILTKFDLIQDAFTIYETYMNYHAYTDESEGLNAFDLLGKQDRLVFCIFNEKHIKRRTIVVPNNMKEYFQETIEIIKPQEKWTDDDFDDAKFMLQNQYDLETLWQLLEDRMHGTTQNKRH